MTQESAPPLGAALTHLRASVRWTQKRLADAIGGRRQTINAIEAGRLTVGRDELLAMARVMGKSESEVTLAILFAAALSGRPADSQPNSPEATCPQDERLASRLALQCGLAEAVTTRAHLLQVARERRIDDARLKAAASWARLQTQPAASRLLAVDRSAEYHNWALALHLCDASIQAARNTSEDALGLAALACKIADLAPGSPAWRSWLQAFCLAHLANARRVAGDLNAADEALARAWKLWKTAAPRRPPAALLPEWRLLDLEASLRKVQGHFATALACLDRAYAMAPVAARGRILLNRQHTLELAGDFAGALAALEAAAPLLLLDTDQRLRFSLEINRLVLLCHLSRHAEAREAYPALHAMAQSLGNKLDQTRVLWLSGRIAAGLGDHQAARKAFESVRQVFVTHRIAFDGALVSLELAIVDLEQGRFAEVTKLAAHLVTLFSIQGVPRESLAALRLFHKAAASKSATPALARDICHYLEAARRNHRLRFVPPT